MGAQITRALITPDNLAFYRIIVGEGRKFPQLLQRYIGAGADKVIDAVAEFVSHHARAAGKPLPNPTLSGSLFFELIRARHHYRALANPDYALSEDEIVAHARAATRVFLHGALADT